MDTTTIRVSWNKASFSFSLNGWRSDSSWFCLNMMAMSNSSSLVPAKDDAQEKRLNGAGSKGFLGVRSPEHMASSICGVIWARTPFSLRDRSRMMSDMSLFFMPSISAANGVMVAAGEIPSGVLRRSMVLRVV